MVVFGQIRVSQIMSSKDSCMSADFVANTSHIIE